MPLHHPPGHAQTDFGEAVVEVGGRREKVAFFCLILPHSDVWFVKSYPRETTDAFLDGHVSAFVFLGGVPRSILYDNTTLAVARILGGGTRRCTRAFTHLQSHYLFRGRFGQPSKGNDKGKVEALVKTARRKFLVPTLKVPELDALNERRCCSPISRPCTICRSSPSRPASTCRARSRLWPCALPAGLRGQANAEVHGTFLRRRVGTLSRRR